MKKAYIQELNRGDIFLYEKPEEKALRAWKFYHKNVDGDYYCELASGGYSIFGVLVLKANEEVIV